MLASAAHRSTTRRTAHQKLATVSIDTLAVGASLRTPIYDDRDDRPVLLLASGARLTRSMVDRLKERGVSRVRLSQDEVARLTAGIEQANLASPRIEGTQNSPSSQPLPSDDFGSIQNDSFLHSITRHGTNEYSSEQAFDYQQSIDRSVDFVDSFFESLTDGDDSNIQGAVAISEQSLVQITEDLDLFVRLGIRPHDDRYPSRHSAQTAMLAMSIGTSLGLKESDLIELGVGCMVHDVGMLQIDQRVVASGRRLGQLDFLEITKHPLRTFDLIRHIPEITAAARLTAYQLHERFDGTGYPRGKRGKQIHFFARIAGVADAFVALVSPRPHRPGMLAYQAMEQMIRDTRAGRYDPVVVRALLRTVSLFPIGSAIETNDGRVGNVLRANGEFFTRPIVELWQPGNRHQVEIINLAEQDRVQVLRVIESMPAEGDFAEPIDDHWE